MSDIDNTNKIIDEYETKKEYYNNLKDDITNLEKSINDIKQNIKNTIDTQNRMKQSNYEIWSQLENKSTQNTKTTEQKEPSIGDILEAFK